MDTELSENDVMLNLIAPLADELEDTVSKKTKCYKDNSQMDEWRRVTDEFVKQLLDPSYLTPPIRSTCLKVAALYPATKTDEDTPSPAGLLPGSHKHLGGAYDPTDGSIYGVPANARAILCLYYAAPENTYRMTTIPLPNCVAETKFKWLRGILAHGYLWAIPSWANAVLCVDVDAFWGRRQGQSQLDDDDDASRFVHLIPLPSNHPPGLTWQWHGAGINQEKTAIYCIPSNAQSVLKVDLLTKTTSLIPITYRAQKYPSFDLSSTNKWYGGIVGQDNCVYGIPYRSCAVLRIDCSHDTATLVGPDFGASKFFWHGGIQVNGQIYAHPSHAQTVLVIDTRIDPENDFADERCFELDIHRADYDTDSCQNYKWLGGMLGADGNIYCPACDTSAVLKIDTSTNVCTTFGFCGTAKNKWQGGVLSPRDECIYCIPASGNSVLRIIPSASRAQLIGELPIHKDKWQGGHVGKDGCLYFIPENGCRVLKVIPPNQPPKLVQRMDDESGEYIMTLDEDKNDVVRLHLL